MNILSRRKYAIEYYRIRVKEGKVYSKFYDASFIVAYSAIIFHNLMNLISCDKIRIRILGSYVC